MQRLNLQIVADLFNVFDKQTPYNINPAVHSSTFSKPQSFYRPATLPVGGQVAVLEGGLRAAGYGLQAGHRQGE